MEQAQKGVEESERGVVGLARHRRAVGGLDHLQVPRREFIPEEAVEEVKGLRESEFAHKVGHLGGSVVKFGAEPFHSLGGRGVGFGIGVDLPPLHKAESIPDFVAEIAAGLAQLLVEKDIVAGGGGHHQPHAHAVGAETVNEVEGIG